MNNAKRSNKGRDFGSRSAQKPFRKFDKDATYSKGGAGDAAPKPKRFYGDKPEFRKEKSDFKKDKSDFRSDKPNFRKDKPDFRKDKTDFRKTRPSFRAERPAVKASEPEVIREGNLLIWGLHAVREAWLNPKRRCHRLWVNESALAGFEATIETARNELLLKRPDPKRVERFELDRITPPGSVHQGIILETSPLHEPILADLINAENPPELLLMLDQVTDPHNVGAILRSAAAFGAGAVIMTERNAPGSTGVLAKAASGALEHIPMLHVVNLARALDELRQAGYWSIGLAEEGENDLGKHDLTGRTVLVLGAEGEGLRQLTRKKCDALARLPTGGAIGSLNVSNAAAVGLYEIRRQQPTQK